MIFRDLGLIENFTFSVQQKKGLLHSADRMFLDKCRTAHTCGDFRDEDRINIYINSQFFT